MLLLKLQTVCPFKGQSLINTETEQEENTEKTHKNTEPYFYTNLRRELPLIISFVLVTYT